MKKVLMVLISISVISAQAYNAARVQDIQKRYPRYASQVQKLVGEIDNSQKLLSYEQKRLGGRKPTENAMQYMSEVADVIQQKESELKGLLDKLELTGDWQIL
jgi:hypothetical protein